MPAAFDACVSGGGEVRTISGPDDRFGGVGDGEYIHVCFLDGKMSPGEVKQKKSEGKNTMTPEELAILKTLAKKFAETPSGPDAHHDGWVDCPTCGEKMPPDAKTCPDCGAKVSKNAAKAADTKKCPECDASMPMDATKCPECDHKMMAQHAKAADVPCKDCTDKAACMKAGGCAKKHAAADATKNCPECDAEIPVDSTECPECGADQGDSEGDTGGGSDEGGRKPPFMKVKKEDHAEQESYLIYGHDTRNEKGRFIPRDMSAAGYHQQKINDAHKEIRGLHSTGLDAVKSGKAPKAEMARLNQIATEASSNARSSSTPENLRASWILVGKKALDSHHSINGVHMGFADAPKPPYGDVPYADPGYQEDKKKRYPIDTEEHIRAAWNYINKEANQSPYSAEDLGKVKNKIIAAWKREIDKEGPPSAAPAKKAAEQAMPRYLTQYGIGTVRLYTKAEPAVPSRLLPYQPSPTAPSHINIYSEKLYTLSGVEIFKVGRWNGDDYNAKDLDEMVQNFAKVGYQVPIKLGHDEKSGDRSFGWISKIYRKGDTLLADFADIPKTVYELLKERAYDAVSAEVFWNLERDGKTYRRALKAVALLGAETPAVSNLAPLRTVIASLPTTGFGRLATYTIKTGRGGISMPRTYQEVSAEVRATRAALYETEKAAATLRFQAADGDTDAVKKLGESDEKITEHREKLDALQDELLELSGGLETQLTTLSEDVKKLLKAKEPEKTEEFHDTGRTYEEVSADIAATRETLVDAEKAASSLRSAAADGNVDAIRQLGEIETRVTDDRTQLFRLQDELLGVTAGLSKKVAKLGGEVKTLTTSMAQSIEATRQGTIQSKVAICSVPAFRPILSAIYEVVTKSAQVAKFKEGDKEVELSGRVLVDKLVSEINAVTAKLFRQNNVPTNVRPDGEEASDENPSVEIDKKAKEHMSRTGEKSYALAAAHVLNEDSELKLRYAKFQSGTH